MSLQYITLDITKLVISVDMVAWTNLVVFFCCVAAEGIIQLIAFLQLSFILSFCCWLHDQIDHAYMNFVDVPCHQK